MSDLLVGVIVLVGCVAVLGLGAWGWAHATLTALRVRAVGIEVAATERAIEQERREQVTQRTHRLVRDYDSPTTDELRDFVRETVPSRNGNQEQPEEYDTSANEGYDFQQPDSSPEYRVQ